MSDLFNNNSKIPFDSNTTSVVRTSNMLSTSEASSENKIPIDSYALEMLCKSDSSFSTINSQYYALLREIKRVPQAVLPRVLPWLLSVGNTQVATMIINNDNSFLLENELNLLFQQNDKYVLPLFDLCMMDKKAFKTNGCYEFLTALKEKNPGYFRFENEDKKNFLHVFFSSKNLLSLECFFNNIFYSYTNSNRTFINISIVSDKINQVGEKLERLNLQHLLLCNDSKGNTPLHCFINNFLRVPEKFIEERCSNDLRPISSFSLQGGGLPYYYRRPPGAYESVKVAPDQLNSGVDSLLQWNQEAFYVENLDGNRPLDLLLEVPSSICGVSILKIDLLKIFLANIQSTPEITVLNCMKENNQLPCFYWSIALGCFGVAGEIFDRLDSTQKNNFKQSYLPLLEGVATCMSASLLDNSGHKSQQAVNVADFLLKNSSTESTLKKMKFFMDRRRMFFGNEKNNTKPEKKIEKQGSGVRLLVEADEVARFQSLYRYAFSSVYKNSVKKYNKIQKTTDTCASILGGATIVSVFGTFAGIVFACAVGVSGGWVPAIIFALVIGMVPLLLALSWGCTYILGRWRMERVLSKSIEADKNVLQGEAVCDKKIENTNKLSSIQSNVTNAQTTEPVKSNALTVGDNKDFRGVSDFSAFGAMKPLLEGDDSDAAVENNQQKPNGPGQH